MINYAAVRLGRKAKREDEKKRTLKFGDYLTAEGLSYPPFCSWVAAVSSWPMLLNDQLGDCTIAGALHLEQLWADNAGSSFVPTNQEALVGYEGAAGYVPTDPSTDQGADMLSVLKYWKNTGFAGLTIAAYASIDLTNRSHVLAATCLLGGIYCGVALPLSVQQNAQQLWSVVPNAGANGQPGSWGGHCVPVVEYNEMDDVYWVVTWGEVVPVTGNFFRNYFDEAYAVFSQQWIEKSGDSPSGLDKAQLLADVAAVAA